VGLVNINTHERR